MGQSVFVWEKSMNEIKKSSGVVFSGAGGARGERAQHVCSGFKDTTRRYLLL